MVMQGSQSLHRPEAMTRSLARPNSCLQCQQINISSFRSNSLGVRGLAAVPRRGNSRHGRRGYFARGQATRVFNAQIKIADSAGRDP